MPGSNVERRVHFHDSVSDPDSGHENAMDRTGGRSGWTEEHAASLREDRSVCSRSIDQGTMFRADIQETFMSGAEIVEMHRTGNYHEDPDVSSNEHALPEASGDEEDEDNNAQDYMESDDTITQLEFVNGNGVAESHDVRSSIELPDALLRTLGEMAAHFPLEEALQRGRGTREFLEDFTSLPFVSVWVSNLAEDMLSVMEANSRADHLRWIKQERFWNESDRHWETFRALQVRLQQHKTQERGLCIAFAEALSGWYQQDRSQAEVFIRFAADAEKTTKANVRLFDIFQWVSTPKSVADSIGNLSLHYHTEAESKMELEHHRQAADGLQYRQEMKNDEEYAALTQHYGAFGFEPEVRQHVILINSFGDFRPPSLDVSVEEQMDYLEACVNIRRMRFEQARERLHHAPGKAHSSDRFIAGYMISFLHGASDFFCEFLKDRVDVAKYESRIRKTMGMLEAHSSEIWDYTEMERGQNRTVSIESPY